MTKLTRVCVHTLDWTEYSSAKSKTRQEKRLQTGHIAHRHCQESAQIFILHVPPERADPGILKNVIRLATYTVIWTKLLYGHRDPR